MLNKKILLVGLLSVGALAACGGPEGLGGEAAVDGVEESEEGPVAETEDALQACNAPVNAHADYIAATRNGSHWCTGCTFVTIRIDNATTGAPVLYYWAGLDYVTTQYFPGFCLGTRCWPGFTRRTGIAGNWYGYAAVDVEGFVTFDHPTTHNRVTITPTQCTPTTVNTTEIRGVGNDGVQYVIRLENVWFS